MRILRDTDPDLGALLGCAAIATALAPSAIVVAEYLSVEAAASRASYLKYSWSGVRHRFK
jgi:hypothetical protein